jgi:hypothetical protein
LPDRPRATRIEDRREEEVDSLIADDLIDL